MIRRIIVIASGALFGGFAGLLGPLVFIGACVWDDRTDWSILAKPELLPYFAVLTVLGTLNGAVGAWAGWRSGASRQWPVAWVPLLLLLYLAKHYAEYPSDSKTWGVSLLAVAIVMPFVWVSGRVGQEIGARGRKAGQGLPSHPSQQV